MQPRSSHLRRLENPRESILIACLFAVVAWSVSPVAGCDRTERSEAARAAEQKWDRHRSEHGGIPSADEGVALDRPFPTLVLTEDETSIRGESAGAVPSAMEMEKHVGERSDGGAAETWVVWSDPDVSVERLARIVETLRISGDSPTVFLAVEVPGNGEAGDVRGVRLAPADNPELAASNAFAVHAPETTPVDAFLGQFRRRRDSDEEGIEQISQ